jgi:polar amino acid transport system substrate-binding protein
MIRKLPVPAALTLNVKCLSENLRRNDGPRIAIRFSYRRYQNGGPMKKPNGVISRTVVISLLLALALSACVPTAPSPASGSSGSPSSDAGPVAATGMHNVVYDSLPDMGGAEVVAVTGNDYIPLNFIDPASGEAVGWEYDAVNEICRRLNCVVDWQVTSWEAMIQAVAEGQFDVGMDGITITAERAEVVDFSDAYMTSQQFMLVRAEEERFDTPEAFAADGSLLIGAQAGTTGFYTAVYDILDGDEGNPRIQLLDSFGASVQALISGDVDMVLVDAASGRGYIGANPEKLKIVGEALATEDFGFIFTPGSEWTASFNAAIQTMQADGYHAYLNVKWFFLYDPN